MQTPHSGKPPTIRAVDAADYEGWSSLYRGYRDFYGLAPDDAVIDRVWSWITDQTHEVNGLVATVDDRPVGLAHYRRFARPSTGSVGLYLDDLFTDPAVRGRGTGRALLSRLSEIAGRDALSVVRWITAEDNAQARHLYDSVATTTKWVTYDLAPGSL